MIRQQKWNLKKGVEGGREGGRNVGGKEGMNGGTIKGVDRVREETKGWRGMKRVNIG